MQKSLATRLPAIQERLPAKLVADLPAGTACNNFLDGGRTLREAVTIIIIIIIIMMMMMMIIMLIRPPSTKFGTVN